MKKHLLTAFISCCFLLTSMASPNFCKEPLNSSTNFKEEYFAKENVASNVLNLWPVSKEKAVDLDFLFPSDAKLFKIWKLLGQPQSDRTFLIRIDPQTFPVQNANNASPTILTVQFLFNKLGITPIDDQGNILKNKDLKDLKISVISDSVHQLKEKDSKLVTRLLKSLGEILGAAGSTKVAKPYKDIVPVTKEIADEIVKPLNPKHSKTVACGAINGSQAYWLLQNPQPTYLLVETSDKVSELALTHTLYIMYDKKLSNGDNTLMKTETNTYKTNVPITDVKIEFLQGNN